MPMPVTLWQRKRRNGREIWENPLFL